MGYYLLTTTFPEGFLDNQLTKDLRYTAVDAYCEAAPGRFKVISSFRVNGKNEVVTLVKAWTPEAHDAAVAAIQDATGTSISSVALTPWEHLDWM